MIYNCSYHTNLLMRERYDITESLSPASLIKQRFIAGVFTGVTMQPSLLSFRIHFCPYVICPIQNVSRLKSYSSTA